MLRECRLLKKWVHLLYNYLVVDLVRRERQLSYLSQDQQGQPRKSRKSVQPGHIRPMSHHGVVSVRASWNSQTELCHGISRYSGVLIQFVDNHSRNFHRTSWVALSALEFLIPNLWFLFQLWVLITVTLWPLGASFNLGRSPGAVAGTSLGSPKIRARPAPWLTTSSLLRGQPFRLGHFVGVLQKSARFLRIVQSTIYSEAMACFRSLGVWQHNSK